MGKVGIKSSNYSNIGYTMADQQTTKHTSIIEELIPTKLLSLYIHMRIYSNKNCNSILLDQCYDNHDRLLVTHNDYMHI